MELRSLIQGQQGRYMYRLETALFAAVSAFESWLDERKIKNPHRHEAHHAQTAKLGQQKFSMITYTLMKINANIVLP